jgi:hypothetical protein
VSLPLLSPMHSTRSSLYSGQLGFTPTSGTCKTSLTQTGITSLIVSNDYTTPGPTPGAGLIPIPQSGYCDHFQIALNPTGLIPHTCASTLSGTLTLELWLVESTGEPIAVTRSMPGLFMATQMQQYPVLKIKDGKLDNGATLIESNVTTIQADSRLRSSSIYDGDSTSAARNSQRIVIPTGLISQSQYSQIWFISVANLNANLYNSSNVSYSMRATCLATLPPPPRNGPYASICSGNGIESNGACSCNSNWGGLDCGFKVPPLSQGSNFFKTSAQSWSFFSITLDSTFSSWNLLVQLTQPNGSFTTYQPVLVLIPLGPDAQNPLSNPPGLNDVLKAKALSVSVSGNGYTGVYSTSSALLTYYSLSDVFNYLICTISNNSQVNLLSTSSWYLGIFNSASSEPTQSLSLTASWGSALTPLCPLSCSNQGTCQAAAYSSNRFYCNCNQGYGGPYCQGPLTSLSTLTSKQTSIASGEWVFLTYTFPSSSSLSTLPQSVNIQWNQQQGSPVLYVNQLYLPANRSQGLGFLGSSGSSFYLDSSKTVTKSYTPGSTWLFALFNSNISSASNAVATFSLSYASPSSPSNEINLLQVVVIAGSSSLICFCLLLIGMKIYLMRQYFLQRQDMIWVQQQILAAEANNRRREDQLGVPPEIVAAFPTFSYNHDEFKKDIEARQEAKKKADEEKAAAASSNASPSANIAVKSIDPSDNKAKAAEALERDVELGEPVMSDEEGDELEPDEKEEEEVNHDDVDNSDLFSCTICIGDYEEGETLRRLPCNHVFHQSCIDPWMEQHTTCPNCRRGLCPRRKRFRNQAHGQGGMSIVQLISEAEQRERAIRPERQQSSHRIRPSNEAAAPSRPSHIRYSGAAGNGTSEAFSIRVRHVAPPQHRQSGTREVEMARAETHMTLPGTPS